MTPSTSEPSGLLLSLADWVRREAAAESRPVDAYLAALTPSRLALLAVGWAALEVSPWSPDRRETIERLLASSEVARVVPLLLSSPAAAGWDAPLGVDGHTWLNLEGADPPSPVRFAPTLTRFPALATKPMGGLWTSTAFADLASVWLTGEPEDWSGGPPPGTTTWTLRAAPSVRCYEIGSRADWVALVEAFPEDSTEFYGLRLDNSNLTWSPPFVTPDWNSVRSAYDAVHLQWAGFVDATYEVVPALGGTTALCGWGSEATLWLRWVFDSYAAL